MFTFINRVLGPYCELQTEFFHLRFVAQAQSVRAKNRKGKNGDPLHTVRIENTRLVRYLLYFYCVPDGFGNDFYSRGTASNF